MNNLRLRDVLIQDFWVHFAALIVIALGVVNWYAQSGFRAEPGAFALSFMIAGLAGMGLKIINGSAAALRAAALDTVFAASRAATAAAAVASAQVVPVPVPVAADKAPE